MANRIIQVISKSPPGMAKTVAIVSTPGTKCTKTIYSNMKMLPIIPAHAFTLLKTHPCSMAIAMIKLAILGIKNPRNAPKLSCAPWASIDSPAAA